MTMTFIASQTVSGSSTSSVDFSSIPSTFTHLQLRIFARQTGSAGAVAGSVFVILNNDTATSSYSIHRLIGNGSFTSSDGFATGSFQAFVSAIPAFSDTTGVFGVAIVDLLDYTNTNKNKTLRALSGYDGNGVGGQAIIGSAAWYSTVAINRITVNAQYGNFVAGTRIDLYGIGVSEQTGA